MAALAIVRRHGRAVMATARRYSATPEDAEDAYQRGLEILLTKAPTTDEDELVPWLRTVVKHEAFALRRQRERHSPVTDDGELSDTGTPAGATHEQAERWERLRHGAEAIRRLKPQELRALLLKAEGYSYREICEITGWTYTKVNRCLTEGRRAFSERLEEIHAGAECERLAGTLSALADGEASAEDLALLRPHLRSCLTCRTRLREFRATPARVAALAPPLAAAASDGGGLRGFVESLLGAVQHKTAALGERAHAAAELAAGQKVAAVAASAAALAGGGAAVEQLALPEARPRPPVAADTRPVAERVAASEPTPAPPPVEAAPAPAPTPVSEPAPEPDPPAPGPAPEFDPVAAQGPTPEAAPADAAFAPGGAPASGASGNGGGGEFAP
ncbi:MAG: sigma-70 family RNA polymerase sigma factor [Thermoleophilaceae bacterium]|nr:sigma-70 family RNA polymerase sigma factor [Thermoleophilaceae bacterium]